MGLVRTQNLRIFRARVNELKRVMIVNDEMPLLSNEEWVTTLRGQPPNLPATQALQSYLTRVLRKTLRRDRELNDDDISDFVQETFVRLVERLDTFRGDSTFKTWATSIAIRIAFTELRRRKVRGRGQEVMRQIREEAEEPATAEDLDSQERVVQALHRAIAEELSERQRVAILAELRGVPTVEIAAQLDTNQNALYKLVHDARKKLKAALVRQGIAADLARDGDSS